MEYLIVAAVIVTAVFIYWLSDHPLDDDDDDNDPMGYA